MATETEVPLKGHSRSSILLLARINLFGLTFY